MPPKISGLLSKFGRKNFLTIFFATTTLDTAYFLDETSRNANVNLKGPLKVYLFSVTFDPETAETPWLIVTYPIRRHYVATIKVATGVSRRGPTRRSGGAS